MTLHAFVDESQRRGTYLMCAVLVQPNQLGVVRSAMRSQLLAGQRRLHFAHESKRRRRAILAAVTDLQAEARIYLSADRPDRARERCLSALIDDLVAAGADRLVLESRSAADVIDRRAIARRLAGRPGTMTYEHLRGHEEPVLWLADAVAWAYGAGGAWRSRVSVARVRALDP
jgi:hypothetical protein